MAIEFGILELVFVPAFFLKQTMLNFWAKFAQKEYFRSQKLKVNITIELSQFKLVSVLYFS